MKYRKSNPKVRGKSNIKEVVEYAAKLNDYGPSATSDIKMKDGKNGSKSGAGTTKKRKKNTKDGMWRPPQATRILYKIENNGDDKG